VVGWSFSPINQISQLLGQLVEIPFSPETAGRQHLAGCWWQNLKSSILLSCLVGTSWQDGRLRKHCKASAIAGDDDIFGCRLLPWERGHDLVLLLIAYPLGIVGTPLFGVFSEFLLEPLVSMPCIK
jgi:hypothetical protein